MASFNGVGAAWLRNGLAALALVLALASVVFSVQIRGLQDHIEGGRADLIKAQAFANVDNSVIQLLAKTAVEKNDPNIRALLTSVGVTIHAPAEAPPASPGAKP